MAACHFFNDETLPAKGQLVRIRFFTTPTLRSLASPESVVDLDTNTGQDMTGPSGASRRSRPPLHWMIVVGVEETPQDQKAHITAHVITSLSVASDAEIYHDSQPGLVSGLFPYPAILPDGQHWSEAGCRGEELASILRRRGIFNTKKSWIFSTPIRFEFPKHFQWFAAITSIYNVGLLAESIAAEAASNSDPAAPSAPPRRWADLRFPNPHVCTWSDSGSSDGMESFFARCTEEGRRAEEKEREEMRVVEEERVRVYLESLELAEN